MQARRFDRGGVSALAVRWHFLYALVDFSGMFYNLMTGLVAFAARIAMVRCFAVLTVAIIVEFPQNVCLLSRSLCPEAMFKRVLMILASRSPPDTAFTSCKMPDSSL